jgi:hypothetical protein
MARISSLPPDPHDTDPTRPWKIVHRDTFDRSEPASAELSGTNGRINGLVELWAKFLFETVHTGSRSVAGPTPGSIAFVEFATRGFSEFGLFIDGVGSVRIDGDLEGGLKLRRWVFGTVQYTLKHAIDEAKLPVLQVIARRHARDLAVEPTAAHLLARALTARDLDAFLALL